MPGGVLAMIRNTWSRNVLEVAIPSEDFIWIKLSFGKDSHLWAGGGYISGPSDPRFRAAQGDGRKDQFEKLTEQLQERAGQLWVFGGDLNSVTHTSQPFWGARDPLDHFAWVKGEWGQAKPWTEDQKWRFYELRTTEGAGGGGMALLARLLIWAHSAHGQICFQRRLGHGREHRPNCTPLC